MVFPRLLIDRYLRKLTIGKFVIISIYVIYFLVSLGTLMEHVLWRDEAQAWLIARASNSLPELVSNLRYEGHPILWYLVIWPFAHLSSDPELIKIPTTLFIFVTAITLFKIKRLYQVEKILFWASCLF
jgi:hypothetical protein